MPTLVNFEYAIPSGKNLTDDYKMKFGGQMRLVEYKNFYLSTKFQGIFRGYKNDLVSIINLGTDVSITLGYYRNRWFLASELGFDKAFGTHLKHTESYKSNYSQVIDGWYGPSTGGNFHYGLQTGLRFGKHEIYSKFGKIISQDFESTPLIPIFFQLGYNLKLGDI